MKKPHRLSSRVEALPITEQRGISRLLRMKRSDRALVFSIVHQIGKSDREGRRLRAKARPAQTDGGAR